MYRTRLLLYLCACMLMVGCGQFGGFPLRPAGVQKWACVCQVTKVGLCHLRNTENSIVRSFFFLGRRERGGGGGSCPLPSQFLTAPPPPPLMHTVSICVAWSFFILFCCCLFSVCGIPSFPPTLPLPPPPPPPTLFPSHKHIRKLGLTVKKPMLIATSFFCLPVSLTQGCGVRMRAPIHWCQSPSVIRKGFFFQLYEIVRLRTPLLLFFVCFSQSFERSRNIGGIFLSFRYEPSCDLITHQTEWFRFMLLPVSWTESPIISVWRLDFQSMKLAAT